VFLLSFLNGRLLVVVSVGSLNLYIIVVGVIFSPRTAQAYMTSLSWGRWQYPCLHLVLISCSLAYPNLFPAPWDSIHTMASIMNDLPALKSKFEAAGQGHLFTFWDQLAPADQAKLGQQLAAIEPSRVIRIFENAMKASKIDTSKTQIAPLPANVYFNASGASADTLEKYRQVGMQAIKEGKVGVLLLAGGQGTRLGSSAPKGCFDIGLPSKKSLFQLQAERLLRLQSLAGGKLPWYVMVSGPTRKDTEDFFVKNHYFGLKKEDIFFFEQGKVFSS
jgi:UDP-N-acetylglucosamine/UDP-N-acetylgalactosamine diphosphorylase